MTARVAGLLLAGLASTAAGAPAAAATTRYALYPLGALALEAPAVGRVERALMAAAAVVPDARLVERKAVERVLGDRRNARLALCEGDLGCLAEVGRALGVERVIAGEAGGLGGGFVVYLRLIDVRTAQEVRSVSAVLKADERGLRASAREAAFRLLAPERFVGRLEVRVDVPGAALYVDGDQVARLPAPAVALTVGTHAIRVAHEAYRDFLRFVDIEFDRTSTLDANLTAFPVVSDQMRAQGARGAAGDSEAEDGRVWYRRWWAVGGFGAVVAGVTFALVATTLDRTSSDYRVHVGPPPR